MAYIKFKNIKTVKEAIVKKQGDNIIRIEEGTPNTSGFRLYLDKEKKCPLDKGEYEAFNTLYRQGEGWYELSNDGSVYQEPEEPVEVEPTEEEREAAERQMKQDEVRAQILLLKNQLESSDYKIIKEYEYAVLGKQTDYDLEELHEQRQALRDAINEREAELAKLEE